MNLYIYKSDQQLGPFDEAQIAQGLSNGQFANDDLAWHEGLTDWVQLGEVLKKPQPITSPNLHESVYPKVIQAVKKQEVDVIGWVCFSLGMLLLFVSQGAGIFIYIPLFIAAFILSILAMVQRKVIKGVVLIICTLACPFSLNYMISVNQFVNKTKIEIVESKLRQIRSLLVQAYQDSHIMGNKNVGFPADIRVSSVKELKRTLVDDNYITSHNWDGLLKEIEIANFSDQDSIDTVVACWNESSNSMIVVTKGGDLLRCKKNDPRIKLPLRSPSFLEK